MLGACLLKEGDLINAYETNYQVDYNSGRYLQENQYPIAMHARNEPFQVNLQLKLQPHNIEPQMEYL